MTDSSVDIVSSSEAKRIFIILPDLGQVPSSHLSQDDATAIWAAATAPWHPAVLARLAKAPALEPLDHPSEPDRQDIRLVSAGSIYRLASGYSVRAADSGSPLLEVDRDRTAIVKQLMSALEPNGYEETELSSDDPKGSALVRDFFALGWGFYWLHELTSAMNHADTLNHEEFNKEVLLSAQAWQAGDWPTVTNRLRAGFELLAQARERYFPMDSYLIDICLLDPSSRVSEVRDLLQDRAAMTFLAPARAIEAFATQEEGASALLCEAIAEGRVDIIGGAFSEAEEGFLPLESVLWQFRAARRIYRTHLEDRDVETLARRRFALYPQLPQIGHRFGFRFALHMCFDSGRFPTRPEIKRLWDGPDGSYLESFLRIPLNASLATDGLRLPWKLAESMNDDYAGTVPLLHWPSPVAPWYSDARRIADFSPVMGRWVTVGDYFHFTDRPYESLHTNLDEYETPYLEQAFKRHDLEIITRRVRHAKLRSELDSAFWLRSFTLALGGPSAAVSGDQELNRLEDELETRQFDVVEPQLQNLRQTWADALAKQICPPKSESEQESESESEPGFLVINPTNSVRQAPVLLPDAAADLRPEGPLRCAQFAEEGTWAVVDLAPHGFAWVPSSTKFEAEPAPFGLVSYRDRVLSNGLIEAEIDLKTGGLRSVRAQGESSARLAQQLAIMGLPEASTMKCEAIDADYAGPALVQAYSKGVICDSEGKPLARFHQQFRLWAYRPILEIQIQISDLDLSWRRQIATTDPWKSALTCRWAWPDSQATLRRTSLHGAYYTTSLRPETSESLQIIARSRECTLLFGGLAHHQRHGSRMLDTLLIAGLENQRTFRMAVSLDNDKLRPTVEDWITPPIVVPVTQKPTQGAQGWLLQIDAPSIIITKVDYQPNSNEGKGWGLALHLVETSGYPARSRLRFFREPLHAQQTDFQNNLVADLTIDADAVLIDLAPHEVIRVDVTLGTT